MCCMQSQHVVSVTSTMASSVSEPVPSQTQIADVRQVLGTSNPHAVALLKLSGCDVQLAIELCETIGDDWKNAVPLMSDAAAGPHVAPTAGPTVSASPDAAPAAAPAAGADAASRPLGDPAVALPAVPLSSCADAAPRVAAAAPAAGAGPPSDRPSGTRGRTPEGIAKRKAAKHARRKRKQPVQTVEVLQGENATLRRELARQQELTSLARKRTEQAARIAFAHGVSAERIGSRRVKASKPSKKDKRAGRNRRQAARRFNDRARAAAM